MSLGCQIRVENLRESEKPARVFFYIYVYDDEEKGRKEDEEGEKRKFDRNGMRGIFLEEFLIVQNETRGLLVRKAATKNIYKQKKTMKKISGI